MTGNTKVVLGIAAVAGLVWLLKRNGIMASPDVDGNYKVEDVGQGEYVRVWTDQDSWVKLV